MVTQRQLNKLKRDLNATIKESEELIKNSREESELSIGFFLVSQENIEQTLENYCKELETYQENLPENDENEKIIENYESIALEGKGSMNRLKGIIKEHERKLQLETEEKEKQRQLETEERDKEKQRQHELTMEKLKIEANEKEKERELRLEMERMKIDAEERKLKVQTEETLQMEKMNIEKTKIEAESKITKDTSGIEKSRSSMNPIRLPKLELKKFDGDILKWQEFWDAYESTIHKNPNLQKVDKFKYLKCQLTGKATDSLAGIDITNENYETAVELLRERFGKLEIMIDAHYAKIANIHSPTYKTTSLRTFYDEAEKHTRALKSLGQDINHRNILMMLKSKLPRSILTRLQQLKDPKEAWTMENFRNILKIYVDMQEEADYQVQLFQSPTDETFRRKTDTHYRQSIPHSTGETLFSNVKDRRKINCIFCNGNHWSDECRTFKSIPERKEKIKGRCFICFSQTHQSRNCTKIKPCFHCGKSKIHHRSLCPQKFISPSEGNTKQHTNTESGMISIGEKVMMQTALVRAVNPKDEILVETRLLLDTGSQRTYITKELSDSLQLEEIGKETLTVYTFGNKKPREMKTTMVDVNLRIGNEEHLIVRASVVPHITGTVQRSPISTEQKKKLEKEFKLADTLPTTMQTSKLGLLIGNDYYQDVVLPERKRLQDGLYAVNSKFGWILSGRAHDINERNAETSMFVMTNTTSKLPADIHNLTPLDSCQDFEPDIEDFWKLDTIGIKTTDDTEKDVLEAFKDTVEKKDGRYQVRWPWREDEPNLPQNYEICKGRLQSLHKRLASKPEILKRYDEIINDQLKKRIIEKAPPVAEGRVHYIPHHAVIKPDKNSTKIRIVYDASTKSKKGNKSLNECLHRGPVILEDLAGLLMRFRTKKIGLIADIEKAFLQVSLQPQDRDVTRFMWIKDIGQPLSPDNFEIYRFTRVPFGIISSPFLLAATIKHHLEQNGSQAALQIKDNIYVDNLITGTEDEEKARDFYKESKIIFNEANMNLRDWKSNAMDFNKELPNDDKIQEDNTTVLGMVWKTTTDELNISTRRFDNMAMATTKRQVLTTMASLFDPLGLLSPVTIKMKIFLQELWIRGQQWDDEIDDKIKVRWKEIMDEMVDLKDVSLPRYIGSLSTELICFCDASGNAYATTIYLRTFKDGLPTVNLIFAKSRVAPKKQLTIPRLELLSALIGVRSLRFVKDQLQIPTIKCILWTDSMCVLSWIRGAKTTSVFVNNRIKEITETKDIVFKYINTNENPADLPTRGISSQRLKNCNLWWHGPSWLINDQIDWPTWNVPEVDLQRIEEESEPKPEVLYEISGVAQDYHIQPKSPFNIEETRYSSLTKLLRVTAYVNRFIQHLRKNTENIGDLTAEEIEDCELLWIKHVQSKHYLTEKGQLNEKQRKSQLNPKIEDSGLIRLYGRFNNAELQDETISPILLPRKEHFTKLLIEDTHCRIHHGGASHTLAQIRQKYWIPQGRAEVKATLRKCLICIRYQGGPYKTKPMAPWPRSKVAKSPAFNNTGLDYFGPLYVKRGKDQTKNWVCLFTCITTRAVHLEVVEDMTPEQFLLALRRFIARRGKPDQIVSDNALQFKVTKNTIDIVWEKVVNDPTVHSYVSEQRIKWSFIIALSPWMGGFYERLVGVTKMALKKSIGKLRLTSLQLQTTLAEIEATLNSRPLIYINDDLKDQTIITPMHFLSINTKNGAPVIDNENEDKNDPDFNNEKPNSSQSLLETWKKGNRHLDLFWEIWRDQYLLSLRERSQIFNKHPRVQSQKEPKIGDIVQLKESTPRGTWKIGKIIELIESRDGRERAARVLLPNKNVLQRSLVHLYPLECNDDDQQYQTNETNEYMDKNEENEEKLTGINENKERTTRPRRKAATEAKDKIYGHSLDEI